MYVIMFAVNKKERKKGNLLCSLRLHLNTSTARYFKTELQNLAEVLGGMYSVHFR